MVFGAVLSFPVTKVKKESRLPHSVPSTWLTRISFTLPTHSVADAQKELDAVKETERGGVWARPCRARAPC